MTRAISIGRGSVGQARLPRRLPSAGAGLVGQTIAQEVSAARREIGGIFARRQADEAQEQERLERAASRGQLKGAGTMINNIGLDVGETILEEEEGTFRSEPGVQDLRTRISQQIQEGLVRFRSENEFNQDVQVVLENELPGFTLGLEEAARRQIQQRSKTILRADRNLEAQQALADVATFDDAEEGFDRIFGDTFGDEALFTGTEARLAAEEWRLAAYQEVLAKAYADDPVEGAALAAQLPDDDQNPAFLNMVRRERQAAVRKMEEEFDPTRGVYGFETLKRDVAFSQADQLEISENPNVVGELFESKLALLNVKQEAFRADRQTALTVLGTPAAVNAIGDNFEVVKQQLIQDQANLEFAFDMISGRQQGVGPLDPTTNNAAEFASKFTLPALRRIGNNGQFAREMAGQIRSFNTLAVSYANEFVHMMTSQDPTLQVRASLAFGELHKQNFIMLGPGKDVIPDEIGAQMLEINRLLTLGVGPAQAVDGVLSASQPESQAVLEQFAKNHLENQVAKLAKLADTFLRFEDTAEDLPPQMVGDFNDLTEFYLLQAGVTVESARRFAFARLQQTWGLTTDGGQSPERWAFRPPSLAHRGQGTDAQQNEQFQADALQFVGRELKNVILLPVENPGFPDGPPAYMVLEETPAGPAFVEIKDQSQGRRIFFWVPEAENNPASTRARAELRVNRKEGLIRSSVSGIDTLVGQMNQAISILSDPQTPQDELYLQKALVVREMIQEATAGRRDPEVSVDEFEAMLERMTSRIPFTSDELRAKGMDFEKWTGRVELDKLKSLLDSIEVLPPPGLGE